MYFYEDFFKFINFLETTLEELGGGLDLIR